MVSAPAWAPELGVINLPSMTSMIPSQFVILRVVTCIAKKETAIKGLLFVKGIYRLDGCVKNMSGIEHGVCYSRHAVEWISSTSRIRR